MKKGTMEKPRVEGRVMLVVFVSLVIDLLAFTMILPLLPALLEYYGQHDQGGLYSSLQQSVTGFRQLVGAPDNARWNSVLFGGMLGSLFSILQFLSSPLMGAASDVYGRRPMMIISMLGIASSYALWSVSSSFSMFVFSRIVGGLSKGNISLSTAIVADIYPAEKRGRGMALIGVAFSVGFLVGPLIGAFFSRAARTHSADMLYTAPALLALLLALIDIVILIMFLRESLPPQKRSKSMGNRLSQAWQLISPVALFRFSALKGLSATDLKSVQAIGWVYFLYLFIYSGLEFTLTFLTYNRFNFDSLQQGKMFFVIGIVMMLVQGGYVRRMKSGQELKIAIRGMSVLIPSFIVVAFAYQTWLLYIGLVLYSFASATVVPCLTTIISSYGSDDQKGTVLGIFRSLGALARALGPVIACTLYWSTSAMICYCIGAVLFIYPLIQLKRLKISHTS